LLEDEEGVCDADGPFVEAASRRYARVRVFIDEASQRSFELLVRVCEGGRVLSAMSVHVGRWYESEDVGTSARQRGIILEVAWHVVRWYSDVPIGMDSN